MIKNIIILALFSGLVASAGAADYGNRTFTAVEFGNQTNRPADVLNTESKKLNNIVKGSIKTNSCYALEKKTVFAWGYTNGMEAWNAVTNFNSSSSNYSGKIFNNVGWTRETKSAEGKWSAFLWTMQNHLEFKSSETDKYAYGSGWVMITNVMVAGLTNYPPMTDQSADWPDVGLAKSNYPGDNQGEEKIYNVDLTTYFQLAIPDISVSPPEAVAAVGGDAVQFAAVGTNIQYGVAWSISPSGVSSGACLTNIAGYSVGVIPGTMPQVYTIRAASSNCPDYYDEGKLTVVRVESILPNIGQEIDDGDTNADTKVFVVSVTNSGDVTVTATLTPQISEANLPSGWTIDGGEGTGKLQRTLGTETASKTTFTFSFDTTQSPKQTTVYVYDAKLGLYADEGNWSSNKYGHSWWKLTVDSDTETFIRDIHPNLDDDQYYGYGGWWPDVQSTNAVFDPIYGWCLEAPGLVRFDGDAYGDHTATGSKEWDIGFDEVVSALSYVRELKMSGKYWTVVLDNCTDEAIIVGNEADISTISYTGPTSPEDLSDWLNAN